jgi:hypothetical protein
MSDRKALAGPRAVDGLVIESVAGFGAWAEAFRHPFGLCLHGDVLLIADTQGKVIHEVTGVRGIDQPTDDTSSAVEESAVQQLLMVALPAQRARAADRTVFALPPPPHSDDCRVGGRRRLCRWPCAQRQIQGPAQRRAGRQRSRDRSAADHR